MPPHLSPHIGQSGLQLTGLTLAAPRFRRALSIGAAWAQEHVEYAVARGMVSGYPDGFYHPEVGVTRDQMAVFVARAFEMPM